MIKNPKIRVDIASGADGDQEQGAGGMGRGRSRPSRNDEEREDSTPFDWRNSPMAEPPQCQDRGDSGGFRGGDKGGDKMERGKFLIEIIFISKRVFSIIHFENRTFWRTLFGFLQSQGSSTRLSFFIQEKLIRSQMRRTF